MRVISQDGLIDVPYSITAFHICGGNIIMNMAGDTGKGTVMARYESDEKAIKAMEMLIETYAKRSTDGFASISAYVRNTVFQFPENEI